MITHVLFIFVSAFIQILWMAYFDQEDSSWESKTDLNTTFYSVINMVQKLAISCIVIDIFYNGEFPQQACQLWVDI